MSEHNPSDIKHKGNENLPIVEHAAESTHTKAEIDAEIEILVSNLDGSTIKRNQLQQSLGALLHSYESAGESVEKFKGAKEALEERLENKTIPDILMEGYRTLIGKGSVEDKGDFLDMSPFASVSRDYRNSGLALRESVTGLTYNKDFVQELMGENLSFRGGKKEGEDRAPREESIAKITQTILDVDEEVSQLDNQIKLKRTESFEAWKKENPEEWAGIQKKEKATTAFEELLASSPTEKELSEVFQSTKYDEIKEKARGLLVDIKRKKGATELFYGLVYGLYSAENYDELVKSFENAHYTRRGDGDNSYAERAYANLQLLHFSDIDMRVVDFAVKKLNVASCYSMGNGSDCVRGGCCMVSNYWDLPVPVQEKIVKKLEKHESAGTRHMVRFFPEVKIAKIKDPLEKAKFILNLGEKSYRDEAGYKPADALSGTERRNAAITYIESGEKEKGLLKVAVGALCPSVEDADKETLGKLLSTLDETLLYENGLFSYMARMLPEDGDYTSYINSDVFSKYLSTLVLKSKTEQEGLRETMERTGHIFESLGLGKYSGTNKSIKAAMVDMVNKHFNEQLIQIKQKEEARRAKIKDTL